METWPVETPFCFKLKYSHFLFGTGFSPSYDKMFMLKIHLKLDKTLERSKQEYNIWLGRYCWSTNTLQNFLKVINFSIKTKKTCKFDVHKKLHYLTQKQWSQE